MDNKPTIKKYIRVFALIVGALLTIITCAGVWNYCPDVFVKVCAILLFCANGYALVRYGMSIANIDVPKPKE